jgi:hypothetical protein
MGINFKLDQKPTTKKIIKPFIMEKYQQIHQYPERQYSREYSPGHKTIAEFQLCNDTSQLGIHFRSNRPEDGRSPIILKTDQDIEKTNVVEKKPYIVQITGSLNHKGKKSPRFARIVNSVEEAKPLFKEDLETAIQDPKNIKIYIPEFPYGSEPSTTKIYPLVYIMVNGKQIECCLKNFFSEENQRCLFQYPCHGYTSLFFPKIEITEELLEIIQKMFDKKKEAEQKLYDENNQRKREQQEQWAKEEEQRQTDKTKKEKLLIDIFYTSYPDKQSEFDQIPEKDRWEAIKQYLIKEKMAIFKENKKTGTYSNSSKGMEFWSAIYTVKLGQTEIKIEQSYIVEEYGDD